MSGQSTWWRMLVLLRLAVLPPKLYLDVLELSVLIILAIDAVYFLCMDTVFDMALKMMYGSKEDN